MLQSQLGVTLDVLRVTEPKAIYLVLRSAGTQHVLLIARSILCNIAARKQSGPVNIRPTIAIPSKDSSSLKPYLSSHGTQGSSDRKQFCSRSMSCSGTGQRTGCA